MNGQPELELFVRPNSKPGYMWAYLESRVPIDPHADPEGFLRALPDAIDTTYVEASPVHAPEDCPFQDARLRKKPEPAAS
jgi:hypothetical protein